jgi:hypothetical protein
MKIQTTLNALLLFSASAFIFSCNQPEKAKETVASTTGNTVAPGAFDRTILPILPHAFAGTVDTNASQSKPDFPVEVEAPAGAPNVLLILTDDVGYGASSTFGGPIETPTFDNLAANGLRFNEFHTTALCSPTRAALISGRNHHNVASGVITEMATGFDGYNSLVPKSTATVGEIQVGGVRCTMCLTGRAVHPARLIFGQMDWALNIFMDS